MSALLLAALVFLPVAGRAADCLPSVAEMLELELVDCRPADVALAERAAGADLWWLRPYLESVAEGNPGVVIRGRVLRFRDVERQATILPWEEGDGFEDEFFYTTLDPDFCGTFDGLETVTLIRERPCCDMIPPPNVACLLDVAEVRPAPEQAPDEYETPPGLADEPE